MKVIKRNGSIENFSICKVSSAVEKAFKSCNKEMPKGLRQILLHTFTTNGDTIGIEEIQNKVEEILMNNKFFDVAKNFILYRERHKNIRDFVRRKGEFINNYKKSSNTANATVDDNSNVSNKNIGILNAEIHKEDNIEISRGMITNKLKELFPELDHKSYINDLNHHIIYKHDESSFAGAISPYCVSISMYPFLLNGIKGIGGLSAAPKNLDSFCGMYINLIFATSAMYAGAVATSEFFVYFDYFARKEWGDDYYKNPDKTISINSLREKTIKSQIHQYFQQVIYSINQPAAARGMQSAFVNFSYFDKPFFEGMFGNFYFPDGSQPIWESLSWLQRDFMQWFNAERLRTMMTFPVESFALVFKDGEFIDKDSAEFVAEEYARGHSFFTYISDTVDSLSSCCFKGSTKVLWKCSYDGVHLTSLKELYNLKWDPYKKNLRIFHNGSWVKGSPIKLTARPLYKVTTFNNKEYYMTDNHLNATLDGEKTTEKLTTNDYLLFNTQPLNAVAENDEHLTFAQGFVIGSFLGDGSFNGKSRNGIIYETVISQNVNKYKETVNQFKSALNSMGLDNTVRVDDPHNNVYNVRVSCKELVDFIQKWTNWHEGTYSYNKELNLNCLAQSIDFRKGILAGWYSTDGGNSNRCYTTSPKLAEDMEALITSLGMQSIIDVSDRTDKKVIIRDQEYNRNYSLYCIRWYEEANHRQNKDTESSWIKFNNGIYFKIKSIEKIENNEEVYCIECKNAKEPYFTLPSGLITHNCRLKNKVQTKEFSFTNGNLGIQTGSKSVITLNLNRIIQDWWHKKGFYIPQHDRIPKLVHTDVKGYSLQEYLINILERVYKYHIAYNELLWDMYDANLLPVYKEGFISLDNQYLTIGINGLNQAAEFLGMECNNNDTYRDFCRLIFTTLKESNSKASGMFNGHKLTFNTECVPAESLAIKNYNWDKKDNYWVPNDTNLYASYIYKPNDERISILDKFNLHGNSFANDCLDGGVAFHCNLDHHLSKEQYSKLLKYAGKVGCSYFTFNIPNCECNKCGYIAKQPFEECPKCGSHSISLYDRIIGYLTKISNWSSGRQTEQKTRIYHKNTEV